MPDIKNTFVKGKMNKDLDPRLIPPGEYLEAVNAYISKSEKSDAGTVQTISSNTQVANVRGSGVTGTFFPRTDYGSSGNDSFGAAIRFETIGYYVDEENDCVYWFITSYPGADSGFHRAKLNTHDCGIFKYALNSGLTTVVLKSVHLNFAKSHPIIHVNKIDDLLFWTDNLNQPRVYNLTSNYLPYSTVSGANLEDQLSVAKLAPYLAPRFLTPKYILQTNGTINNSTTVTIDAPPSDLSTDLSAGVKFLVRHVSIDDDVKVVSVSGTNNTTLTLNKAITLTRDDQKLTLVTGSMINSTDQSIDNKYIKERFVRFSYRYKFADNTFSTFAPFSQIAFIPALGTLTDDLQKEAYQTTKLNTFVNNINQLELELLLPSNRPFLHYHIKEIEILIKESDDLAVKVLDTIDVSENQNATSGAMFDLRKDVSTITAGAIGSTKLKAYINNINESANANNSSFNNRQTDLYYVYRSEQGFKTLPEAQTLRTFDKVPTKALAQEVSGNRVIYGNFTTGKVLPTIDYIVSSGLKSNDDEFLYGELPRHTLKQNRTYVVGVVLADRYGRQSPVLLAKDSSSSLLHRRASKSDTWPGDCLKITFNDIIAPTNELYDYGTYDTINPLGWYSYRVVVKQLQQEYHNVYTPGVTIYPSSSTNAGFGYLALYGDNINKIPRNEINQNLNIDLATSSVKLHGIVENKDQTGLQTSEHSIISIGKLSDLGIPQQDQDEFFGGADSATGDAKNYLFAQMKNDFGELHSVNANNADDNLAVFETAPFESKIDIFYETSTSGLIKDLNTKILSGTSNIPFAASLSATSFAESATENSFLANLVIKDNADNTLSNSSHGLAIAITSIQRSNSPDPGTPFSFTLDSGVFKLKLLNAQQFLGTGKNIFTIDFTATTSTGAASFSLNINITNVAPSAFNNATPSNTSTANISYTPGVTGTLTTVNASGVIKAINGSSSTSKQTENLTFSKPSGSAKVDVSSSGVISLNTAIGSTEATNTFVLRTTDIGGLTHDLTVSLVLGTTNTIEINTTCGGTTTPRFNFYDLCYGGDGGSEQGDKEQYEFVPSVPCIVELSGACSGNFQKFTSNNTERTHNSPQVNPAPAAEIFESIQVSGTTVLQLSDLGSAPNNSNNEYRFFYRPGTGTTANASNFNVTINSAVFTLIVGANGRSIFTPIKFYLVPVANLTTTQHTNSPLS